MKTNDLSKKYSNKELAESFVFRSQLSKKQKEEADNELREVRKKAKEQMTSKQKLLARLLQLRFQIEDYSRKTVYNDKLTFGYFLREYVKSLDKRNYEFANDISIKTTELSQIINSHRKPTEKMIIRLEIHSNKTIPAVIWFKLLEKEREHEIATNTAIRKTESRHVKNKLDLAYSH